MKKLAISLLLASVMVSYSYADEAEFDTTKQQVGPGYTHMELSSDEPQRINILKMDITREGNRIESVLANDKLGKGFETTTSMSRRNSVDGNVVFGALNADYFGMGNPDDPFGFVNNNHIENGEFVVGKSYFRSQFGVEDGSEPFIDILDFQGYLTDEEDIHVPVRGVNIQRGAQHAFLYTRHIGSTRTDDSGIEIELSPANGKLPMNASTSATVEEIYTETGNNSIPESRVIVSAAEQQTLEQLEVGDELQLHMGTLAEPDGSVIAESGESAKITGYNTGRGTDDLILYDAHFGTSTGTNQFGTEIKLEPTETDDTYQVTAIESKVGDMEIEPETYILSGHGEANNFLDNNFTEGDEVTLDIAMADYDYISALVGGGPKIVDNGDIPEDFEGLERFQDSHVFNRHPRSAVGISEDSTYVYFVAVDGRNALAAEGMSLPELAEFMKDLGAYNAVNLDGGGSTTLTVRNEMANIGTAGDQRPVGNALIAVTEINYDDIATSIGFGEEYQQQELEMFTDDTVSVDAAVLDKWEFPLPAGFGQIDFRIEGFNGTFDTAGNLSVQQEEEGEGYLIAEYQDISDSLSITIQEAPVSAEDEEEVIREYELEENYPNPFNPSTAIPFQLPEQTSVTITIFDIEGRKIRTLVDGVMDEGHHEVTFDASGLSTGTYIYELQTGHFTDQKQMMFMK